MTTLATTSSATLRGLKNDRPAAPSPIRACDALESLQSSPLAAQAPSPLFAVLLALLTLGAGPAVLWAWRFRVAAQRENAVLRCVTEWAESHLRDPAARRPLDAALRGVRAPLIPNFFTIFFAVAAVLLAGAGFFILPTHAEPSQLWIGSTYGFHWPRYSDLEWHFLRWRIFGAWTACLFASYLLHLATVHLYSRHVQRYLNVFNRLVAVEEGFAPVLLETIGWKSSPLWGLASAALLVVSGWWGIPLAVAGMTDARYRKRASCKMRLDLIDRVRCLIHLRAAYHDAATVPVTRAPIVRCATPGCDTPLAPKAKFCARCGARRGRAIDRRA